MPLRGGRLRQWVPEEPEVVAAIVAGAVGPGVGRVMHLAQMKCPDLVGVAGCPQAQVRCDVGGMQPAFFAQFTQGCCCGGLARLDGAFDQLQACQGVLKSQDLDVALAADDHRACLARWR